MAFNSDRNRSGGDRGGFRSRPSFGDRPGGRPRFNDRGPVEMHKAVCDNCGRECEVPFRPTQGKPVYCSNCFESQRGGSDSRKYDGRNSERSEDRPMFNATCADCGNACKVPFQPSSDKPVYCSNCFGEKKNAGYGQQFNEQIEAINSKLDSILKLLAPVVPVEKPIKVAKKKIKEEEITSVKEE